MSVWSFPLLFFSLSPIGTRIFVSLLKYWLQQLQLVYGASERVSWPSQSFAVLPYFYFHPFYIEIKFLSTKVLATIRALINKLCIHNFSSFPLKKELLPFSLFFSFFFVVGVWRRKGIGREGKSREKPNHLALVVWSGIFVHHHHQLQLPLFQNYSTNQRTDRPTDQPTPHQQFSSSFLRLSKRVIKM